MLEIIPNKKPPTIDMTVGGNDAIGYPYFSRGGTGGITCRFAIFSGVSLKTSST